MEGIYSTSPPDSKALNGPTLPPSELSSQGLGSQVLYLGPTEGPEVRWPTLVSPPSLEASSNGSTLVT